MFYLLYAYISLVYIGNLFPYSSKHFFFYLWLRMFSNEL